MKEKYWYWLCNMEGILQPQIRMLLQVYDSPEEIYKASDKSLEELEFLTESEKTVMIKAKRADIERDWDDLLSRNISFVSVESPAFPLQLRYLNDRPYGLYYKGQLPDPDKYSVGIVGARQCSDYGKKAALDFSAKLALNDIQIISGMAYGIDTYASRGALSVNGKTFVVLGTGVDFIYPLENAGLYYDILDAGGGVISEFRPGTAGAAWQFPFRNRLVSGFSDKLLIIEAKKNSGTLTTAQHALSQAVDIYALPGRICDRLSDGCNRLIADGCGLLSDINDLLDDIRARPPKSKYIGCGTLEDAKTTTDGGRKRGAVKKRNRRRAKPDFSGDGSLTSVIYSNMGTRPVSFQQIAEGSGRPINEVTEALSELLITGLLEEVSKGIFIRK